MNKTISINLNGQVFNIEELAYDKLKDYFDALRRVFKSNSEINEIMKDIEARIAEKFSVILLDRKTEVITEQNVTLVMQEMGDPSDFAEAEETEGFSNEAKQETFSNASNRLYRNTKNKAISGVAYGLSEYLKVDPMLVRILWLVSFFFYGFGLLPYILLWIFLPVKDENGIDNERVVTKLYRDEEDKIVGGVASGLAAYFGIEKNLVRVLFVILSVWAGVSIIIYIILWIALPKAQTETQKMEMRGIDPNVGNIKKNYDSRVNSVDKNGFEQVKKSSSEIVKTVTRIWLIVFGAILLFFTSMIILTATTIATLCYSFLNGYMNNLIPIPLQNITGSEAISFTLVTTAFLCIFIPAFLILSVSLKLIFNKRILNSTVRTTMIVVWFVCFFGFLSTFLRVMPNFAIQSNVETENVFSVPESNVLLVNNISEENGYDAVDVKFIESEDNLIHVITEIGSQGFDKKDAQKNAQMVENNTSYNDSVLVIDNDLHFKKDAIFRGQNADIIVKVPKNVILKFIGGKHIYHNYMSHYSRKGVIRYKFNNSILMSGHLYKMENGKLSCLDCESNEDEN